ncbi:MAG TPA: response regulator [Myxococcaceae bacterium]|nr:response regulator [Myxococcaceae bacterium]
MSPRHYLIVDDNPAFAENLAEILRDLGSEVAVASSGAQALELMGAQRFSAMMTDMRMPVMNGAALVQEARKVDPGLPVVAITAYIQDTDLESARRHGLLAVLPKPVPIRPLMQLLDVARRDGLVTLVEDDVGLSDNLTEALRMKGFTTVTANTVLDAEKLGPWRPFAAIVDWRVEGGPDGEAMRQLAARFPGLPMLLISAYDVHPPPVPHHGLFPKPFNTALLLETIERLHAAGAVRS